MPPRHDAVAARGAAAVCPAERADVGRFGSAPCCAAAREALEIKGAAGCAWLDAAAAPGRAPAARRAYQPPPKPVRAWPGNPPTIPTGTLIS
jgi:hypothetical protein